MTESLAAPAPHRSSRAVTITIVAVLAACVILAVIGAGQAARQERVLPVLDLPAQWLRESGEALREWAIANSSSVAWTTTGIASAIALAGCLLGGWQAVPLWLLAAAVSLATWGQVRLLQDDVTTGAWLYGAGALCGIVLGRWCPAPPLTLSRRPSWFSGREGLAVFLLMMIAVLTRLYALTELPRYFEIENILSILATRTATGLREYVPIGLTSNSNGLAHLLPQTASFTLFGTSVYSLRLVSVCFGVVVLFLFYWLVRRLAGVGPAFVGTALLIAAPEQLYWSRSEVTPFVALALLGVVTVHLGLRMAERLSVGTILAAALGMPFSMFFYVPARVMLAYPLLLYAHALVFKGRAAWRTIWYAVPLFAGGIALSYVSLSFVFLPLNDWQWRYIPSLPTDTTFLQGEGQFHETGLLALAVRQVTGVATNLSVVAQSMTYRGGFSEWYQRADNEQHPTVSNVAMVVMAALALAYLLGQIHEPRSIALLLWIGLGLLPGILSANPAPRRIGLIYPALYAAIAVAAGAVVRLLLDRAGRVLTVIAGVAIGVALGGIIWTSLASYFLLRMGTPWVEHAFRSTAPLFERDGVIYQNIDSAVFSLVVFLNVDRFLQTTPGLQYVKPGDWLPVALRQPCDFTDERFRFTLPPSAVETLRNAYHPTRMSVLMMQEPQNQPYMDLLQALYPSATVSAFKVGEEQGGFWMLSVERAAIEALRSPTLRVAGPDEQAAELATRLIAQVRLTPVASEDSPPELADRIEVQGGLLVEREGWYRLALEPPCAAARLTIDGRRLAPADVQPMRVGVHALQIGLPNAGACTLPVNLRLEAYDGQHYAPVTAPLLLTPALAALPHAAAPPVSIDDGYGYVELLPKRDGLLLDFSVDSQGEMTLLVEDKDRAVRIRRVSADGREVAAWTVPVPPGQQLGGLSVAPDGVSFVIFDGSVKLYDRQGTDLGMWKELPVNTSGIGHLPDGRAVIPLPGQNALAVVNRDGSVAHGWKTFEGGPGTFFQPVVAAVHSNGDLLVIQTDGGALLFHSGDGDGFHPVFVREFRFDFGGSNVRPRGASFVGTDRVVVSEPETGKRLLYGLDGTRVMAADPARDLGRMRFGGVRRVQATGDRLYVLDDQGLWTVRR